MMKHLSLYVIAAMVLLSGCQREISGKYLGRFTNGICWLQLVRTPDNHLTGQLETLVLGSHGKIERNAVSVTGAVNAGIVTISASLWGVPTVTLSGTFDGNRLTLTGGQPSPMVLTRSDISEYQQQVNTFTAQSRQVLATEASEVARRTTERVQQNFITRIDQIVGGMEKFDSEADVHLGRFPRVEARYHAITARVAEYVGRERQLAGNPGAAVARGQLSVAANQTSIATDQLHNEAQALQWSIQTNVQPIAAEATAFEQGCRGVVPPGDLTPAQADARNDACRRLFLADPPFRQKFGAVVAGFADIEQVYARERSAQQELLRSAQRLQ